MVYKTTFINGKKIILDEDGKPCRTCNSLEDFMAAGSLMGTANPPSTSSDPYKADPPSYKAVGSSTWTFLHSMAAHYPKKPSKEEQKNMDTFIKSFSYVFPCEPCAADFRDYLEDNAPAVKSRDDLSLWFCEAHNEVNTKLGKPTFDCKNWRARWRDGWEALKRES